MASLYGAACFQIPAIDGGGILHKRTSLTTRKGCLSVARVTSFCNTPSSSKHSLSFKCLTISSNARTGVEEAVETEKAPAALGPNHILKQTKSTTFFLSLVFSVLFCLVPETGKFISDNVEDQTEQVVRATHRLLRQQLCWLT